MASKALQRSTNDSRHDDVAVVISSCDKYRDLWPPFFTLFFRYWPDCPYPVDLITNFDVYPDTRIRTIRMGRDRNWSSIFAGTLRQISEPLVLVMMEDYLLDRPVDTRRIRELVDYLKSRRAACVRLLPVPGPDAPCPDNPQVGEIRKGAEYRLSLQAAIWDRQVLLKLLRWGESAWELERFGSKRTDSLEAPFLSVRRDLPEGPPLHYFCTAVVRGMWLPEAVQLCEKEGIRVDLSARPLFREPSPHSSVKEKALAYMRRRARLVWRRP
jgi:hypothetical protein